MALEATLSAGKLAGGFTMPRLERKHQSQGSPPANLPAARRVATGTMTRMI
jgi:hypothetical protein